MQRGAAQRQPPWFRVLCRLNGLWPALTFEMGTSGSSERLSAENGKARIAENDSTEIVNIGGIRRAIFASGLQ